jgi:hypothetical protein
MEHTQVLHSARRPSRIAVRNSLMLLLFSTPSRSPPGRAPISDIRASNGPEMKKHGCTRPVAPMTAENSGALQRTGG